MEQALLDTFGVTGPYEDIQAAGRTDKAITTDLFNFHGIELSTENWTRFLDCYLTQLPISLSRQQGLVLPGIIEILEHLGSVEDVTLGLLTGNLKIAADVKLNHFAIGHHFLFGGFGDDHPNRDDVARLAWEAAGAHLGQELSHETVWVIGDTPADIKCGRAIGAKTVAVATGIYSSDQLEPHQPDFLFEDFSDVTRVLDCLLADTKTAS